MKTKVFILCFAILACTVLLLNNASSVVYDVCEAMSDEEISHDDFQVLIESIYNGECNEAMNVKTTFSMSKDDFSELAYTYNIIDSEGNPLVFYRTGTPSPLGAGAILVYGNDGDFPVKLGDRLHIWTSGTPKDIMIELSIEGCDPYDDECDAICSYEDDYVCDPECYKDGERNDIQCDIDCVDQNNNHIVDQGDLDGICDPDCYNDDLDPKRAYDPDCIDFSNDKTNSDGICDPDSQGIRDGLCDPDCALANHLCDFDCNGTAHPGNPHGYNDTDCYVCDGICNGFCSYDCGYLDHDPDCPEGFTDWFELTECCGNNNCGMSENCLSCPADCPPDNISVDPPVERNCSILNEGPADNFFCCPDANNSAMYGCANLTLNKQENESCTCQPECAEGLVCNGPKGDKHCCPAGKVWNGTMCKLSGDVLIVALKSNLGMYSAGQITSLEDKINEFIEALAADGLGASFFYLDEDMTSDVTPGGIKVENTGSSDDIDSVLNVLIPKLKSKYLIIIGGYDQFPQVYIGTDAFGLGYACHTDDHYGDIDGDSRPDIPVGRMPDPNNGDIDVILNTLDTAINLHKTGGVDLSDYTSTVMSPNVWPIGNHYHQTTFGKSCSADTRCVITPNCKLDEVNSKSFILILLHGSYGSPQDFGCNYASECPCTSFGFTPSSMTGFDLVDATWFTMCCSGSVINNKQTTSSSVPLTFLKKQGALYFGNACITPGGPGCIADLYIEIAKGFSVGARAGDAFLEGKNHYVSNYNCGAGTLYQYHLVLLYGDPTLKIKNRW
ncbi:MAG: hypothetical protein U9Q92_07835 [archaeon]|nr:hypothetical protein [archaeon]